MYQAGTILALKEPKPDEFPYNRVEVVGPSPVQHSERSTEWVGSNGDGVIIKPAGEVFGSNLDEPYGKLQRLYDVESLPPEPSATPAPVKVITPENAGPSPEEQFANIAATEGEDGRSRKPVPPRTSPLDGEVIDPPAAHNRGADEEFAPTASEPEDERPDDLDVGA